jgi:hypothetical protein
MLSFFEKISYAVIFSYATLCVGSYADVISIVPDDANPIITVIEQIKE